MKKLFLLLSVATLIALGPVRPILHSFLPVFDVGIAHAQDTQGDDDNQGDQNIDEQ